MYKVPINEIMSHKHKSDRQQRHKVIINTVNTSRL